MICVFSTTFRMRYIDDCIYEKLFLLIAIASFLLGCSGNKKGEYFCKMKRVLSY